MFIRALMIAATVTVIAGNALAQTPPAPAASTTPAVAQATPAGTSTLVVQVVNIANNDGMILAQISRKEGSTITPVGTAFVPANAAGAQLRFEHLAPGEYAVSMFHDEDGDREMARSAFGMPLEGFGFSNNAMANMGPPRFAEMAVTISQDGQTVTTGATMQYMGH